MSRARIAAWLSIVFVTAAGVSWLVWPRERAHVTGTPTAKNETPMATELPRPAKAARTERPPEVEAPAAETNPGAFVDLSEFESIEDSIEKKSWPELYGQIISSSDRSPLREATIGNPRRFSSGRELRESARALDQTKTIVHVDESGRFALDEKVEGSLLVASAPGFGPALVDRAWLGKSPEEALVIPLARAASLRAHVTDHRGAARQGCEIRLLAAAYEATQPRGRPIENVLMLVAGETRETDDQGTAEFSDLPAGVPFDVELWSGQTRLQREPTSIVLEPRQEMSREWRLGAGCTVRGEVIDQAGAPASGETLWLTQTGLFLRSQGGRALLYSGDEEHVSKSTSTDAHGRFEIRDVPPGRWWLGIAVVHRYKFEPVDENAIAPVAESFDVTEGQSGVDLVLHVTRGLYIRGRLVDPDGKPSAGFVHASPCSGDCIGFADTQPRNDDGAFVLGPLEPGDHALVGEPVGSKDADRTLAPSEPIVVAAGRDDVQVRLRRGGTIRAKAVRKDTGAEIKASFCLVSPKNPTRMWGSGGFDLNFPPDFAGLEPGTYDLSAVTADGQAGRLQGILLEAGQVLEDVRVIVEPGARLVLHYVGKEPEYAQVSLWVGTTWCGGDGIHRGTSSSFVAPRGKVTVRWQAEAETFDEEVDLAVGETRELTWPRAK